MKSENACYRLSQNLLSSSILPRNLKIRILRFIILPFVLYECETWSLTLGEERRLTLFGNRVLRRIIVTKRNKEKREWRKLPNEKHHDMYCSPNILRVIRLCRMKWRGGGM